MNPTRRRGTTIHWGDPALRLHSSTENVLAAADVRDLAGAIKAAAKLAEIVRKLAGLTGDGRLDHARELLKGLEFASIEAI